MQQIISSKETKEKILVVLSGTFITFLEATGIVIAHSRIIDIFRWHYQNYLSEQRFNRYKSMVVVDVSFQVLY